MRNSGWRSPSSDLLARICVSNVFGNKWREIRHFNFIPVPRVDHYSKTMPAFRRGVSVYSRHFQRMFATTRSDAQGQVSKNGATARLIHWMTSHEVFREAIAVETRVDF